jgi:hypothetical protein
MLFLRLWVDNITIKNTSFENLSQNLPKVVELSQSVDNLEHQLNMSQQQLEVPKEINKVLLFCWCTFYQPHWGKKAR